MGMAVDFSTVPYHKPLLWKGSCAEEDWYALPLGADSGAVSYGREVFEWNI